VDRFVIRENIARYREMLDRETAPEQRLLLTRLIAEEQRKLHGLQAKTPE
jgi:hypothetical protein